MDRGRSDSVLTSGRSDEIWRGVAWGCMDEELNFDVNGTCWLMKWRQGDDTTIDQFTMQSLNSRTLPQLSDSYEWWLQYKL